MDYCTLFPEGWWSHCCDGHDTDYLNQIGQSLADGWLQQCVAASMPEIAAAHPVIAGVAAVASAAVSWVMYSGVRIFGRRWYRKAGEGK